MIFPAHSVMWHAALHRVVKVGTFPLSSEPGLMPGLITELIDAGWVTGVARGHAPLALSENGRLLWERWQRSTFWPCHCRLSLTSHSYTG